MGDRYFVVTFSDGARYRIDPQVVYDSYDDFRGQGVHEEAGGADLIDWMRGDMNWNDVRDSATRIVEPDVGANYCDEWSSGEAKIEAKEAPNAP